MNIRRISALTIALSLLLSLTACGGQGDSSQGSASDAAPAASDQSSGGASAAQSFSLGYYKGEGLHPYTCSNTTNQNLMGLIYEPLFAIRPDLRHRAMPGQELYHPGSPLPPALRRRRARRGMPVKQAQKGMKPIKRTHPRKKKRRNSPAARSQVRPPVPSSSETM